MDVRKTGRDSWILKFCRRSVWITLSHYTLKQHFIKKIKNFSNKYKQCLSIKKKNTKPSQKSPLYFMFSLFIVLMTPGQLKNTRKFQK